MYQFSNSKLSDLTPDFQSEFSASSLKATRRRCVAIGIYLSTSWSCRHAAAAGARQAVTGAHPLDAGGRQSHQGVDPAAVCGRKLFCEETRPLPRGPSGAAERSRRCRLRRRPAEGEATDGLWRKPAQAANNEPRGLAAPAHGRPSRTDGHAVFVEQPHHWLHPVHQDVPKQECASSLLYPACRSGARARRRPCH